MSIPAPNPARTSLVTGASSGIGAEVAGLLAQRGLGVTLVARREAKLRELADTLASRHGVRAEVIACDLTDGASRAALPAELAERGLDVNVLVNNAGLSTWGPVVSNDPGGDLTLVRTNVEAVVHLCSLFLPGMVERRSGAVLNVASTAAFQPLPGQAAYAASKSFVLSYSHAIRAELSGTGVSVTVLCPGPVKTGFTEAAGITDEEAEAPLPKFLWLSVEEVARVAVAGLDAGRAVVVPGIGNRVSASAAWLAPRSLIMPLLAKKHPAMKR